MYARKALSRAGSNHDRPKRRGNIVERIAAAREQREEIVISKSARTANTELKIKPEGTPDNAAETVLSSSDWLDGETGFPQMDLRNHEADLSDIDFGSDEQDPSHTELRNELREIMAIDPADTANNAESPPVAKAAARPSKLTWVFFAAIGGMLAFAASVLSAMA